MAELVPPYSPPPPIPPFSHCLVRMGVSRPFVPGYRFPLQRFRDLVTVSGLSTIRPKTLLRHLLDCMEDSSDGTMTAEAFGTALTKIFTIETLRKQFSSYSDHTVGSALMTVYDAFGSYGGEVDSNEFMSGLLLLCAGSKSEKLSLAFSLFDSENSGWLSRRSVWKYIRSFLTALATHSSACATMELETVQMMADAGAVDVTADIFLYSQRAVRVSFGAC